MALVLADRVQETSTTSGTGTITLSGAVPGFQDFLTGIGSGNETYYTIYDPTTYEWEVGIGTFTSSGTDTLSRDTVLSNSLGTTAKINLVGNQTNVFVTYPSEKSVNLDSSGNVSPLGTIASGTWQGSTVGVAYGGTGVTTSSGANSVVLRDSNQNIVANKISQSVANVTASGGTTTLTSSSAFWQTLQGTGAHTIKLPDATTLPIGFWYIFDNDSTGNLTVQDFASSTLDVVPPGGYSLFYLDDISSVAGSWNRAGLIPSDVNWGTNSLDLGGSTVVTNGTWQGTAVAPAYGGTGLTTFAGANNALYSTGASTLTAGTLPVLAGGTGTTTSTGTGDVVLSIAPTLTGAVTIGSTTGSDTITLGRSTGAQTVNVASGANSLSAKTVNIATGATNGSTTVTIGPTGAVNGTTTINIGTQTRSSNPTTVNIATGSTGGNANTVIGSSSNAGSLTTINGGLDVSPLAGNSIQLRAPTNVTVTVGNTNTTGTMTLGQSTVTNTTDIQAGATSTGNTKTINIGTSGVSGSTTNITIGTSSGGTSNTTLNGTVTLQNALAVASGGTGLTSLTTNYIPYGNGTGAYQSSATFTYNGTTLSASNYSTGGNLTFTGTGNRITGDFSNATIANRVAFQTSTTNSNTALLTIPNGTATFSGWQFSNNSDPTTSAYLQVGASSTSAAIVSGIFGTGTYLPMTFFTGGSERMRIDTSGNVGIGTTTPNTKLEVYGQRIRVNATPDPGIEFANTAAVKGYVFYDTTNDVMTMRHASSTGISVGASGQLGVGGANYGSSGQVLTSQGSGAAPSWTTISSIPYTVVLFASSGSWTVPAGVTTAKVTVCGGGGGSSGTSGSVIGGQGGFASAYLTGLTPGNSITVTIGAGGSSGSSATAGGTTSFGSFLSATGGTAGSGSATNGVRGTGTVSSGTNLGTGAVNDGGSATEGSFAVTQYGFAIFRPSGSGRNAAVAWSPTLGMHPGAAGVGSGTSSLRSGAIGGFVAIEY